ncbi:MAG: D-alanyl-D-alanine carboxypeptidase family protein [Candidatus Saccharibacteria bacterium]|nr:D-alanyl-D-alanine carboxypeptidase family protein [Candidatus Saccharibacteria bacterium]
MKKFTFKKWYLLPLILIPVIAGTTTFIIIKVNSHEEPAPSEPVAEETPAETEEPEKPEEEPEEEKEEKEEESETTETQPAAPSKPTTATGSFSAYTSENCTLMFGNGDLALINPVFTVSTNFIAQRATELTNITAKYGIVETNNWNGTPYLDADAAVHLNDMNNAYKQAYPGHSLQTMSCFRSRGTSCGRLCYATGTSDHHTGLTCDLIDPSYGTVLSTDYYPDHKDWQWLKANSYKYGFIDRFPEEWAGGPMSQPVNITEAGSTGLHETWHYRYVGIQAATEIATGKYNNGKYDSLEHYLKARGLITSLTTGKCKN